MPFSYNPKDIENRQQTMIEYMHIQNLRQI